MHTCSNYNAFYCESSIVLIKTMSENTEKRKFGFFSEKAFPTSKHLIGKKQQVFLLNIDLYEKRDL